MKGIVFYNKDEGRDDLPEERRKVYYREHVGENVCTFASKLANIIVGSFGKNVYDEL